MNPNGKTLVVFSITLLWCCCCWFREGAADAQINLLQEGCSQYKVSNESAFYANLNATFADLRRELNNNSKYFATAQHAMVQCRNYLSHADCIACCDAAISQIRNCSGANGGRVIYDGCFLRYESGSFYDQTTMPGNAGICRNDTASQSDVFSAAVKELLGDLLVATPRINGFYAASKKDVVGGVGNATVYAVAQCVETVSESGCQDCLKVATSNAEVCLPNTAARAVDAGCFLRYSGTAFFADNQTTNIIPFLGNGSSSKKAAIIGGVVGGVGALLIIIALLVWFKKSRKRRPVVRGKVM